MSRAPSSPSRPTVRGTTRSVNRDPRPNGGPTGPHGNPNMNLGEEGERLLFSIEDGGDDDDDEENGAEEGEESRRSDETLRPRSSTLTQRNLIDDTRVPSSIGTGNGNGINTYPPSKPRDIGISLKSTISSREAEFELDSDEIPPNVVGRGDVLVDTRDHERGMYEEEDDILSGDGHNVPLLDGESGGFEGFLHSGRARGSVEPRASGSGSGSGLVGVDGDVVDSWMDKGGGLLASVANMANSILGAGVIGLPYALREAGLFTGLSLLIILGAATDWTLRLMVLNAKLSSQNTYIGIMDAGYGEKGRMAVGLFMFAFAWGGCVGFGVIVGDTIPHVLSWLVPASQTSPFLQWLFSRQVVIVFLTLTISYPLSLYRDIDKLSKASGMALISMIVIVLTVLVRGPAVTYDLKGDPDERWTFIQGGVFEAIGVISFAFVCHHNTLLIYGSLRTPTLDRFNKVTRISTTISVVACATMALGGFLVFTDKTRGNILNNFSADDGWVNFARACFGFNMFTTLPLEAFVCREVIETYFYPGAPFDSQRHVVFTTLIVGSAMLVSLMTCDLGVILEVVGGFSATALAYIFPAISYLRLSSSKTNGTRRTMAWCCAGFGACVMVLSTALAVFKAWGDKKGGSRSCSSSN